MRKFYYLLVLILTCPGCGPGISRPSANPKVEQQARQMATAGQYQAAADEYLKLVKLYPKQAGHYTLLAAGALLNAGQSDKAAALINKADMSASEPEDAVRKSLLQAQLALAHGAAAEALANTDAPLPEGTSAALQRLRHRIRAQAFEAGHRPLSAARELAALIAGLPAGIERDDDVQTLWDHLNTLSSARLDGARASAGANFRSWLELALINQTMMERPDVLKPALQSWISAHPGHPAIPAITDRILALSQRFNVRPQHIALLLPLSGEYQDASEAVRDGFIAAWYQDKGYRPQINVYDTNSLNVSEIYKKAVAAGADFVVGPLEKTAVTQLAKMAPLNVTTLALNQDDAAESSTLGPSSPKEFPTFMEFGLPPEDEARQVADRGIDDGHTRVLVITPGNEWGNRLYSAFASEWQLLGGVILDHVEYFPGRNNYSAAVSALLNVDSSEARAKLLRQTLHRRLHSESRHRQDADMIFIAAAPITARQIVPQFLFYGAGNIAMYATSSVFSGVVDPEVDGDLDGVRFPDMPWLLDPAQLNSPLQTAINRNWKADSSPFRRLYAFGVDAFRLIPQLGMLASGESHTFAGATGTLFMDQNDRIHRKLTWAEIVNGRPQLLDSGTAAN